MLTVNQKNLKRGRLESPVPLFAGQCTPLIESDQAIDELYESHDQLSVLAHLLILDRLEQLIDSAQDIGYRDCKRHKHASAAQQNHKPGRSGISQYTDAHGLCPSKEAKHSAKEKIREQCLSLPVTAIAFHSGLPSLSSFRAGIPNSRRIGGSYANLSFKRGIPMDFSLLNATAASIGLAREFSKAALAVRDFNEMAAIVSKLNDQILEAQDKLFALQRELFREQQERLEADKKIVELTQALHDRDEYDLIDIGNGFRAYQRKTPAVAGTEDSPRVSGSGQILCQPCFEGKGIKSTLQPAMGIGTLTQLGYECRICKERFITGGNMQGSGPIHEASMAAQLSALGKTRR
jgi:hypothetical protein